MGKLFNFDEVKAKKDGKITPLAVAESVVDYIKKNPGAVEKLAIVVRMDDGMINTAMSTMSYLELIGIHDTAKQIAYEEMTE
jgi:hypothetical protein